jgi:hypothetical protein
VRREGGIVALGKKKDARLENMPIAKGSGVVQGR